jgi:hypothetical protein
MTANNFRCTVKNQVRTPTFFGTDPAGILAFVFQTEEPLAWGTFEILSQDPNLKLLNGELVTAPQTFNFDFR